MPAAFDDSLDDIDPIAQKWFHKHYLPALQKQQETWTAVMPILQENSRKRVEQNRNYQLFLQEITEKIQPIESSNYGRNDLQMEEAVNILKDMIFTEQSALQN